MKICYRIHQSLPKIEIIITNAQVNGNLGAYIGYEQHFENVSNIYAYYFIDDNLRKYI